MAARSTQVQFFNGTPHTLTKTAQDLSHGEWTTEPPQVILPQTNAAWESESDGFLTGTEGTVTYQISDDLGDLLGVPPPFELHLHWDNPFVGSNSYDESAPAVFPLTRTGGGGDNATVSYALGEFSFRTLVSPPPFSVGTMLLLTDGSVLALQANGAGTARLLPDADGRYVTGTWQAQASMLTPRLYFASAVLADGRVLVAGGEYNGGTTQPDITNCEIYDPPTDTWKSIPAPAGWNNVGDAPCCVLPNGRVLVGNIFSTATALFDPATDTFSAAGLNGAKNDNSAEETWTLLPDGSVLCVDCTAQNKAERYVPAQDKWVAARDVPVPLAQALSLEIGPGILLNDGRAFCIGGTGATALYTPPAGRDLLGSWVQGPNFPADTAGNVYEAKDAPACLLPGGDVLCAASPKDDTQATYPGPTHLFRYSPGAGTITEIATGTLNFSQACFTATFLLLPTGEVLIASQSAAVGLYLPQDAPDPAWRPRIRTVAPGLIEGRTYPIYGTRLNGNSQACSYGDDAMMATNYPLVRLQTSDGLVHFCRTHGHSTMGVADPSTQSTFFDVPTGIATGGAQLVVIANGIASLPAPVSVLQLFEVTCINKPAGRADKTHRIETLGGPGWRRSEAEIIAELLGKDPRSAYEVTAGGKAVAVVVAGDAHHPYLKTVDDNFLPDNLLSLPDCL